MNIIITSSFSCTCLVARRWSILRSLSRCLLLMSSTYGISVIIQSVCAMNPNSCLNSCQRHRDINGAMYAKMMTTRLWCKSRPYRFPAAKAALGWHYLSTATCLMRPHSCYACFVVSRITIICHMIRHF